MASMFLLQMLPKRGPEAFERFIQVLMSCEQQKFIARELDPELARKYDTPDSEDVKEPVRTRAVDRGCKNLGF